MAGLDAGVVAAVAGTVGVIVAKVLEVNLERFRLRNAEKLNETKVMSQATAQLIEQQNAALADLREQLKSSEAREQDAHTRLSDLEADMRSLTRRERDLADENDRLRLQVTRSQPGNAGGDRT